MALNIHSGCYCCGGHLSAAKMDIDAALNELGMLSSVTESRKQFLQERMRTHSESALMTKYHLKPSTPSLSPVPSALCYKIVHIDSKYVTGVTDVSCQTSNVHLPVLQKSDSNQTVSQAFSHVNEVLVDNYKHSRMPPENFDSMVDQRRSLQLKYKCKDVMVRNRRILARKRAQKPYEVPWRLSQSFQESLLHGDDIPESKSNCSSPVKPVYPESLPRSRSLDNLDFSTFFISETGGKADIDNVAYRLKNLNVSNL